MVVPSEDEKLQDGAEESRTVELATTRKPGDESEESSECYSVCSHDASEFTQSSFLELPTNIETTNEKFGFYSLDGRGVVDYPLQVESPSYEHETMVHGIYQHQTATQDEQQMSFVHFQHPTRPPVGPIPDQQHTAKALDKATLQDGRHSYPFAHWLYQHPIDDTKDDLHFQQPSETREGNNAPFTAPVVPIPKHHPEEELLHTASPPKVTYQQQVASPGDSVTLVSFDLFEKIVQGYLQLWFHRIIVHQRRNAGAPVHSILLPDEVNAVAVQDEVNSAVAHFYSAVSHVMKGHRSGSPVPASEMLDTSRVGDLPGHPGSVTAATTKVLLELLPRATRDGLTLPHMERAAKFRPSDLLYDTQAPKTKKRKSIPRSHKSSASSATSPSHRTQRARKKMSRERTTSADSTSNGTTNDHCHEGKNIEKQIRSQQHPERP
jgi:hypothetical protein